MSKKYLYYFSEGNKAFGGDKTTMKNILGGKGAGLAEMTAAGMPVPAVRSTMRSLRISSSTSRAWRRSPARSLAITQTPCWFPSVPARVSPCPA
jgi:hypothetical protein